MEVSDCGGGQLRVISGKCVEHGEGNHNGGGVAEGGTKKKKKKKKKNALAMIRPLALTKAGGPVGLEGAGCCLNDMLAVAETS